MVTIARLLQSFVSGNWGISLGLCCFGGLVAWRARHLLHELWADTNRVWRLSVRLALVLQLLVLIWVGLFDYWRQLLGLLMTNATAGYSDPYAAPPVLARHIVADPVRVVSLALVLVGGLGLALVIARSGMGPFPPLAVGVLGGLLYAVLSDARWRMELWAANGYNQVGRGTTGDLLVDATFFVFLILFCAALILLVYAALASWLALPLIIVSGFFAARFVRPTDNYRAFTAILSARAAAARAQRRGGTGEDRDT